ncbi:MAG: Gfo/Idh/MocA family oxidoreductase [Elusimicrobia bacterium]|nr:Gfo/Idh/MocA family oxidoreductase [Elusimicrobiota bacterium]
MSKTGVAVVGYGYWGPNLVRSIADNPDCDLVMVCDKRTDRLAPVKNRYPSARCTGNFEEVLWNPSVEAVVLATPVSSHFPLAQRILSSGRHVLVEKPLSTSSREARALLSLAQKKRRVLMAGHTFVYSPPVRKVKELLKRGVLGKIYTMDFSRVNLGLFQPDVNVLWDLGPHDISIALYWLGKVPLTVRAEAKTFVQGKIEEVGYLSMEFPGGIWVRNHVSWLAPVKLRRVSVVGSRQMLVYDDTDPVEKVKIYNRGVLKNPETFGEFQLTYRSGDIYSPRISSEEPLYGECADFIRAIRAGRKPESDAHFGLQVVRVLEAAQKSLKQGGKIVRL